MEVKMILAYCPSSRTRYFQCSVLQWPVLDWGPILRQLLDECQSKPACNYNLYKHHFGSNKGYAARDNQVMVLTVTCWRIVLNVVLVCYSNAVVSRLS
ncbi:hypothetical protein Ahy_A07g033616 isoform C [Arachis hypogaea]|uniref:Uncharacterized protein n=1 Tax=Arachis hypogaea TaxID=3818 RepID=A0A445C9Q6_ARAHY|nr:hypothetical protein Ahy_A07g033616 isoform C [Arachis hypogaea]